MEVNFPSSLEPQTQMGITRRQSWFKFIPFGRSLLPWLGVSANEATIKNLSLALEDIIQSAAKTIAAQQISLDCLAKIGFNTRIAEQGSVCAMANTTCCSWIETSGDVETQLHKIPE